MKGYIDNYNFAELDCQKYWQPPSTWSKEKESRKQLIEFLVVLGWERAKWTGRFMFF